MKCTCTCSCFMGTIEDLRKEIKQLFDKKDNFYHKINIYENIEIARKSLNSIDSFLKEIGGDNTTIHGNKTRIWQAASCLETAKRKLMAVHNVYAKYLGDEEGS